jgi:hypothetical protein
MHNAMEENEQDWRLRIDGRRCRVDGDAGALSVDGLSAWAADVQIFRPRGPMVFFFSSSFASRPFAGLRFHWDARPRLSPFAYSINRIFRILPLPCAMIALTYWNRASFFLDRPILAVRLSATLGKAPGVLWTTPIELMFCLYLPSSLQWRCRPCERASAARCWRSPMSPGALQLRRLDERTRQLRFG